MSLHGLFEALSIFCEVVRAERKEGAGGLCLMENTKGTKNSVLFGV